MADIKRLHYFDHQFLVAEDFTDEQKYHLDMRRRHNRVLHTFGVADGLQVVKTGDKEIAIRPGTALDRDGQEIVLDADHPLDLSDSVTYPPGSNIHVTIAYEELETEPTKATGVSGNTRVTERSQIQATTASPPIDGSVIRLAHFVLDGSGNVPGATGTIFDNGVRQFAGTVISSGSVGNNHLADSSITEPKLATNAVSNRTLRKNAVTGANITDGSVETAELANGAVTNSKLGNNSVNAAKISNGAVGTAELADGTVSIQKLKTKLVWDSTTSISANGTRGFNVLATPLSEPRGASFLIHAYSTTQKGRFEWSEVSLTGGGSTPWINQSVSFHNLVNITIEIKFKIYMML